MVWPNFSYFKFWICESYIKITQQNLRATIILQVQVIEYLVQFIEGLTFVRFVFATIWKREFGSEVSTGNLDTINFAVEHTVLNSKGIKVEVILVFKRLLAY